MCDICQVPHALCRWPAVHDCVNDTASSFRETLTMLIAQRFTETIATGGTMLLAVKLLSRAPRAHEVGQMSRFWLSQTDGRDYATMMTCVQQNIRDAIMDLPNLHRNLFQLCDVETPYLSTDDLVAEHLIYTASASVDMSLMFTVMDTLIIRVSYATIGPDTRAIFRYMDRTNRVTYYNHRLQRCPPFDWDVNNSRNHAKPQRPFDMANLHQCEYEPLTIENRYGLMVVGLHVSNLCAVVVDLYRKTIEHKVELNCELTDAIVRANSSNSSNSSIDWLPCQARRRGGVVVLHDHETLRKFRSFLSNTPETSTLVFVDRARNVESYRAMPHVIVRTKGDWTNLPAVKRVVFECVPVSYAIGSDDAAAMTLLMQSVEIVWALTIDTNHLRDIYDVFDFPTAMAYFTNFTDTLYSHNLFCLY